MGQKTKKWAVLTTAVVLGLGLTTPAKAEITSIVAGDGIEVTTTDGEAKVSSTYASNLEFGDVTVVGDNNSHADDNLQLVLLGNYNRTKKGCHTVSLVGLGNYYDSRTDYYGNTVSLVGTANNLYGGRGTVFGDGNTVYGGGDSELGLDASLVFGRGNFIGYIGDSDVLIEGALAYGLNNEIQANNTIVFGANNRVESTANNALVLGMNIETVAANSVVIGDGSTSEAADTVSIGSATKQRKIVHVATGTDDTDAVNVAQLKSYVASQIGSGTGTGTASASALAGNGLVATSDNKLAIDTSGGAIAENNTGFVTGGTIWKYIQDNAGSGSSAAIGDTTKLSDAGLADNVTDSILSVNDKLTKEGSYAAANGKVEIKNNAGDVAFTITGLNTDATDLGDTQKLVDAGLGKTVTDSILSVNDKVGSLSDDINKVGAGAAALAALRPEGFDPDDKWSFAVGYGHYKNANAGALGAFFKPNADTTVSIGGTIGNGDPMMNAGVSFKLGNRGKKAGTYRNVRDVVERVDRLEEFSMQQSARIDAQDRIISLQTERIQKLEAQVAMLMQHAGLTDSVQKTATR